MHKSDLEQVVDALGTPQLVFFSLLRDLAVLINQKRCQTIKWVACSAGYEFVKTFDLFMFFLKYSICAFECNLRLNEVMTDAVCLHITSI